MILIADSGSTKTIWCVIDNNSNCIAKLETKGINPVFLSTEGIIEIINEVQFKDIEKVYFYGAGCALDDKRIIVTDALKSIFSNAEINVYSDMLGAAHGLCGNESGIVCILGTGSNSCYYKNGEILKNVSPLGFILGDEGSGAVLGKKLVGDYLKNQMPDELAQKFALKYNLTIADAVNKVYREQFPNRFLATFCPFLSENINHEYTYNLLYTSFCEFINRNIKQYDYANNKVHFIGSIAYNFKDILQQACKNNDIKIGNISQNPIEGLIKYHLNITNA